MRVQRMGIAARHKSHADIELPGEVLLLGFVESAQESPPTITTIDADRTVDVTIVRAKQLTLEFYQIIGVEHLRDDRRSMIEFISKRAQKPDKRAIDNSDRRSQVFRQLGDLHARKLRRQKTLVPLFLSKIVNEIF